MIYGDWTAQVGLSGAGLWRLMGRQMDKQLALGKKETRFLEKVSSNLYDVCRRKKFRNFVSTDAIGWD